MPTLKIQKADGTFEFLQLAGEEFADIGNQVLDVKSQLAHTTTDLEGRGLNVRLFGVKGDGTDDTIAFRNLLLNGGHIYIPNGTYNLQTWTPLEYAYNKSVLIVADKDAVITGNNTDFMKGTNKNISIIGGTYTNFRNLLNLSEVSSPVENLRVENCAFRNFSDYVIGSGSGLGEELLQATIRGNYFKDCSAGVMLRMKKMSDIIIENNIMEDLTSRGIHLGNNDVANQDNWKRYIIRNNIIKRIITSSSSTPRGIIVYGTHAIITNNLIEKIIGSNSDSEGIYTKCRYTIISNNNLIDAGNGQGFISVKGSKADEEPGTPQGHSSIVVNNMLRMTSGYPQEVINAVGGSGNIRGIKVQNEYVLVQGNRMEGFNSSCLITGGSNYDNVTIDNNYFHTTGTLCVYYTGNGKGIRITNNTIEAGGNYPISCRNGNSTYPNSDIYVGGNTIKGTIGSSILGIELSPSSGNNSVMIFENNIFGDNVTVGFITANARTREVVIRNNKFLRRIEYFRNTSANHAPVNFVFRGNEGVERVTTTSSADRFQIQYNTPLSGLGSLTYTAVAESDDKIDYAMFRKTAFFRYDQEANLITILREDTNYEFKTEGASSWNCLMEVLSNRQPRIRINGQSGRTIRWKVDINLEVKSQWETSQ